MINAKVVAHSVNEFGDELISFEGVLPRINLAELNTHREFSRNSASSRAIPTHKMLKSLIEEPFIPLAWQKEHKGMRGTEYLNEQEAEQAKAIWLAARDEQIQEVKCLIGHEDTYGHGNEPVYGIHVTKQLANRLLEPFMYHKVLITTGLDGLQNFFDLRCPIYVIKEDDREMTFSSRKSLLKFYHNPRTLWGKPVDELTEVDWLMHNKGQAEIHIMAFAEAMYDAFYESKYKTLKAGEWHIPYEDKIDIIENYSFFNTEALIIQASNKNLTYSQAVYEVKVRIATAMAARTSYTKVGDEKGITYDKLLGIYEKMKNQKPFHASPFEHCNKAMGHERFSFVRGNYVQGKFEDDNSVGWCRNFKGFIQLRHIIESQLS